MKILFFTYRLPYPTLSGGQTRAFNLIKGISKKNEVTLFSFIKKDSELYGVEEMRRYCEKVVTFRRRSVFSPRNLLLSLFSKKPFASSLYFSSDVAKKLKKEIEEGFYDWVHFESYYPAVFLPKIKGVKTLMGNENAEYLVYERFAQSQFFPLNKVISLDAQKMKKYEEFLWREASLNTAVSEQDARLVKEVTGKDCPVIPNGVDTNFFSNIKRRDDGNTLLYVGSFRYIQNQDAIRYLAKRIWPELKQKNPELKIMLVGRDPTAEIKNLKSSSIEIRSDFEDIRNAYELASVLVVPIRAASGTRLKILEAMASGVPVVSTSLGVEGIGAKNNQEVLIADDPKSFVSATIKILEESRLRAKITTAAKKLVEEKFSWDKIAQNLNYLYENYS